MTRATDLPLQRQLRRVRRRLLAQRLIDALAWAWAIALLLAAGWFLVQPFVIGAAAPWLRWAILAGLFGLATVAALVGAYVGRPPRVATALALDERFKLRERVTTSVLLSSHEAASPAGLALLADVNKRLAPVAVADKFPVRLRWPAALVPACALGLAAIALFYHPRPRSAAGSTELLAENPAVVAEIEQKLRELQKKGGARSPQEQSKSADQERMDAELDKLSRQPRETKEQAREVVKEMSTLEERMQRREKELAEKANALKAQMAQLERVSGKKDKEKDGPAKDLDKALKQGDFDKARQETEKLARQLQNEQEMDRLRKKQQDQSLTPEERDRINEQIEKLGKEDLTGQDKERLLDQLQDIEQKLERLSRSREEMEKALREMARNGGISQEELDRELEQLKDVQPLDAETLEKLKKMAQRLAKARKAMKEGKNDEAARELDELAKELGECDCNGEASRLGKQLAQLQAARRALCQALDGNNPTTGRRPESREKPTQHKEERARAPFDRGRLQVIDHVPGTGFNGPRKPVEMVDDIRRAAQEAPEAIDRQRLPRSASDMARGYFEKLRGGEKTAPR